MPPLSRIFLFRTMRRNVQTTQDVYRWAAIYTDGTVIAEYDIPEGRGFADVDAARVREFKIESAETTLHSHYIDVPPGATPVFFRRRKLVLRLDGSEQGRGTVHCIGWERDGQGVYLFVDDLGSTILSADKGAV